MSNWHNKSTDELCKALLSIKNIEECYAFLEDICTIKEFLDISQRLDVARLLKQGVSYTKIASITGASSATISRVSRCCEYGTGGYKTIIDRLEQNKND